VHAKALIQLGVSLHTIAELRRHHWRWGVVHASAVDEGLFYPGEGPLHLVIPVYEDGALVDLCAFRSNGPTAWLLRTGLGWALGLERGLERHTWGDPVHLSVSPLEWLQRGCDGLCVLDWDAPEVRYLVGVPHVICSTPALANRLRSALAKPARFPLITVEDVRHAA
jgi:hypothetical protein